MTSHATRTQSSSEQNDLKKLKSKYSSKLATLKELFADWSDEDLLFALDEADGILEVAVDRISEGHATQWGEVKTKKAKKEAQQKAKAAAAAAEPSASQTMSYQKPERTYPDRSKPTKARTPNSNSYSRKPAAATTTSWGYSSNHKTSSSSAIDTAGGSWASIASTRPAHDSSLDRNATSNTAFDTTFTSANDFRDQPSWGNETNEITETTTSSALLDDSDKPKSWASLLKSQSKPEPSRETESVEPQPQHTEIIEDAWNTKGNEHVIDEWSAPVETPADPWGATAEFGDASKFSTDLVEKDDSEKPTRRLTQEEPVVMPNNNAAVTSLDVKFGSLNLDGDAAQQTTQEILTDTKVETQSQSQPPVNAKPTADQNTLTSFNTSHQPTQKPSTFKKEEPIYTQPQQQTSAPAPVQVQQLNQPQQLSHQQLAQTSQQPQQTPLGMDHLTSAYNSYLPNQHLTGVSGFGMNPVNNLPDYNVYGSEAQRAAAMGYYDPSAFNNSPISTNTSAYPSRDKFGQDTSASIGTPQGQTAPGQGLQNQQMYPGMPYYPYYYMPNHYNAYQQSMYGQPMMNKSAYSNVYQQPQQTASVSKPSSQPSYGGSGAAASSPYGLNSQLYDQPSHMGGYDLQRQSGSYDYQQLQGFLGHHLPGQQTSQQSQSPSQSVDPTKGDISRANVTSSQPQHQHTNNYFNQQQMFNYQQYPQQQYWNQ